jgi:hypothetical protein
VIHAAGKRRGKLKLELPPPCRFVRDEKGTVQTYLFKDINNATALLVVGGPISKQRTDELMTQGCGTQAQVVLLRRGSVATTRDIGRGGIFCPLGGVEEKLFSILAHAKLRHGRSSRAEGIRQ